MRLDALRRAHGALKIQRLSLLWEADADQAGVAPLVADMIAAASGTGAGAADLTLNVSNVVVEPRDDEQEGGDPEPGEYVAISVSGRVPPEERRWRVGHLS